MTSSLPRRTSGVQQRLKGVFAPLTLGLLTLGLLTLAGCVSHLQAPPADLRDVSAVPPAEQLSFLGASLHLPHAQLVTLLEPQLPPPFVGRQSAGPLTLSYQVGRSGPLQLSGDAEGRLCIQQFFAGTGLVQAPLYRQEQRLQLQLTACMRPQLDGADRIRLQEPVVRVLVERGGLTGPLGGLLDFLSDDVQQRASAWATSALARLTIPTDPLLQPVVQRLQKPIDLAMGACLRLRAQSVLLAQPQVDGSGLSLAASVAARPSAEQPCAASTTRSARPTVAVGTHLKAPQTWLQLPIGVALETLEAPLRQALVGRGKVELTSGWLRALGVRLQTSQGRLLAKVPIEGEWQTKLLGFIPWTKEVRGEVLLWGTPTIERGGVRLAGLQVDVRSDSELVEWVASLKRSDLVRLVDEQLRLSERQLQDSARTALAAWSQGVEAGGVRLPLAITVEELSLQRIAATGQRLLAELRFVGRIAVGQPAGAAR